MKIDFYSYFLGSVVALSYLIFPRFEKIIDILFNRYYKWKRKNFKRGVQNVQ